MPPSENLRPRPAALRALAVLAALAAGLALAACGGSNAAGDAAAGERAREHEDEAKAAKFAKCLREHGIQASASSSGGGFQLTVRPGAGSSPQKMEAAQKACQKFQPAPRSVKLSPQERVKREGELLKFAKCMREHGVNLHVDLSSGGKVAIGIHRTPGSGGPNPESPAFQAAQKACSGYLPFKTKGGAPLGPPPGRRSGEGPSTNSSPGGAKAGFAIGG